MTKPNSGLDAEGAGAEPKRSDVQSEAGDEGTRLCEIYMGDVGQCLVMLGTPLSHFMVSSMLSWHSSSSR